MFNPVNALIFSNTQILSKMTTKLIYVFVIGATVTVLSSNAQTQYCYMEDENPYLNFATVTAYETTRAKEMETLPDCKPMYLWALIRHGTRFMTKMKSASGMIKTLKNEIVKNHEGHERGQLCDKDLRSIKQWHYKWDAVTNGELASQGKSDMASLAARLNERFPSLLSAPLENFKFQTSSVPRCKDSSIAFTNELFKNRPTDLRRINIEENDSFLRILDQKEDIGADGNEYEKFIKSEYVTQMISEINDRLGYEEPLSFYNVSLLYAFCAFQSAWELHSKASFCTSFTPEHLQIMEYAEDLDHYYSTGYGNEMNAKLATPLVRDLFTTLDIASKNKTSEVASIYFSHSQALLPFIVKLGLFRDEEPLKNDTYEKLKETRKWRTSFIDPFAANIIAVLYKCATEDKVMFYNNENLINFPSCENGVCSLKTLKKKFENEFEEGKISKSSKLFASVIVSCVVSFVSSFRFLL